MELARLEKYKKQFKELKNEINSLQTYLSDISKSHAISILTPYVISKKLDIPEMDAFFLLSLAEQEHILHKKFKVWSEDHYLLGDFDSNISIPDRITNSATGMEVDRSQFHVDIVFEIDR